MNGERRSSGNAWQTELAKVETQILGVIDSARAGMFRGYVKAELGALEASEKQLTTLLVEVSEDKPDLLLTASAIYRMKVAKLAEVLNHPEDRPGALGELRMTIEKIVLTPGPNPSEIDVTLYGRLGRFLNWTARQAVGKKVHRPHRGILRSVGVGGCGGSQPPRPTFD